MEKETTERPDNEQIVGLALAPRCPHLFKHFANFFREGPFR